MPGYPCGCRRMSGCGDCQGTAPEQYQLTVPSDVFGGSGNCGSACENFNGVFILDYNPDLTYMYSSDVTCIWESPTFDSCYLCLGDPLECYHKTWRWRVELSEELADDGKKRAYVILKSTDLQYYYLWLGEFTGSDCASELTVNWSTNGSTPTLGCDVDQSKTLTLEAAP